ncbi:MAG TPA: hypothetical protein VMM84_16475 [Pyrinomonadaceae bacterium]|nr:hypothetical protein [Pyrinomonadaceae bacterium]
MKIKILAVAIIALVCFGQFSYQHAQQTGSGASARKCDQSERRQFDFWIGEWEVSWGENQKGTNSIRSTLDGCVILENFDGTPAIALKGTSVSTYSSQAAKWQQTWVDNQGSYLDFAGGWRDGKMVLERKASIEGKSILQRMVWYNIKPDSLDWNWERSNDNGKTWELLWKISYRRKQ